MKKDLVECYRDTDGMEIYFAGSGLHSIKDINAIILKKLTALEIIKKKKVDVKYLYYRAEFNVEKYNDNYIETLTKKECKLLKEVLK